MKCLKPLLVCIEFASICYLLLLVYSNWSYIQWFNHCVDYDCWFRDVPSVATSQKLQYFLLGFGFVLFILLYVSRRLLPNERRRFTFSFVLLYLICMLVITSYIQYQKKPSLKQYFPHKNNANSVISVKYDPKVRLELFVYPGSTEEKWLQDEYIPMLQEKFGENLHTIISNPQNDYVQKRLFSMTFTRGYFDDGPIYASISDASIGYFQLLAQEESIQEYCETCIQHCIRIRRKYARR